MVKLEGISLVPEYSIKSKANVSKAQIEKVQHWTVGQLSVYFLSLFVPYFIGFAFFCDMAKAEL